MNTDTYYMPRERWERLAVVVYSGDNLQLPLVTATSSMPAPLNGTTNEHKVGDKTFRDAAFGWNNGCESMQASPKAGFAVNEETAAVLHRPHRPANAQCCTVRIILRRRGAVQPVSACACCASLPAHLSRAFARYVIRTNVQYENSLLLAL